MRVFIEAAAGSVDKHVYDPATLVPLRTLALRTPYPFPYGFVLDTEGADGDAVDCYVITARALAVGDIVECEPAAMLEQLEDGEIDHKILARFPDEATDVSRAVVETLRRFIAEVFAAFPSTHVELGRVHDDAAARAHVEQHRR